MEQAELGLQEQGSKTIALSGSMAGFEGLEAFTKLINEKPPKSSIQRTPDGSADTMGISFVETKLDEVYLRQWGTRDVSVLQIANEVIMWLTLYVIDPLTKMEITRSGCAAAQITVDKVPDAVKADPKARNSWALNMENKKPNALYLAFPKLKSLAIKNAAQTLGKAFGRDLNRKYEDTPGDFYGDLLSGNENLSEAKKALEKETTQAGFAAIWNANPSLQENEEFKKNFLYYQRKNVKGNG